MCWQLELTGGVMGVWATLLPAFSEVIKKCGKWLWRKAGRMEGILRSSLPSSVSQGCGEAHLLPPTPSSKLHHYWAWRRDTHWWDKAETGNVEIGVSSPLANEAWEALFFLPCLTFLLSSFTFKKLALARCELLCLSISVSWWPGEQLKSSDWGSLAMVYVCQVSEQPMGLNAWIHSFKNKLARGIYK